MVSVALQLPPTEADGVPNGRLTDKFPSDTTLWLILRKFEAAVAGSSNLKKNFTARGVPATSQGGSGAGRLYYESPVIQVMGREFSSFTDLQKTLAQLGLNSGTALLRLSFTTSDQPIEDAMKQIAGFFESDSDAPQQSTSLQTESTKTGGAAQDSNPELSTQSKAVPEWTEDEALQQENVKADDPNDEAQSTQNMATAGGRPVSVYAPPATSTPTAAQSSFDPSDYNPTVEHAQSHQRMLSHYSRNVRLPTDAEIAQQADVEQAKNATIKEVEVKIRFPDETAVSARFGQEDSGSSLYDFVRGCLDQRWQGQVFELRAPGGGSATQSTSNPLSRVNSATGISGALPDTDSRKIIKDFGLKGRVLLVFQWDASADAEARGSRQILKPELRSRAQKLEIAEALASVEDDDRGVQVNLGQQAQKGSEDDPGGKKKMPKWLKGLSKK